VDAPGLRVLFGSKEAEEKDCRWYQVLLLYHLPKRETSSGIDDKSEKFLLPNNIQYRRVMA
jgi:hypothetical protein